LLKLTNVFSLLAKPVQEAIRKHKFSSPTEAQIRAIPLILEGKNVLLIAPTATGKTEAAILPVLSMFLSDRETIPGIRILYLTPLRALNRDLFERLEWWCSQLDVKVAVRHGDTDLSERAKQSKSPPDMLITTPETLQAILPGRVMKRHLSHVRFVIIDEIHELAEDKRGSQLALALERLRWITMKDFQLIGLSATIGTPERVAKFLAGSEREVEVVKVSISRKMKLRVTYPVPSSEDYDLSTKLFTHPEVAARLRVMRELIEGHRSVLLFTNTRAVAEILASRFKVWDIDFPVSIHHGSLAKPARVTAERGIKEGNLKGLVCTSSLELGIDVGRIDFCIQYNSPRQVTRLIQRVGRSGHRIGLVPDGVIITMDSDDTLEALVISRRAYEELLEPVSIPVKPYDALTHQIVGLLTQRRRWYFNEILELFRSAYPYRDLTEEELISVLNYMHSRYPRLAWISQEDKIVLRPQRVKEMYAYYYDKLSMIPDEKQYLIIDESSDTPVGVLDEAFVAEYGELGTKFICRGSPWKMASIQGDKIYVKPIKDPSGAIPSWVGEEIPVPFDIAREVGWIRGYAAESYRKTRSREDIVAELTRKYSTDPETMLRALSETFEQVDKGFEVPTDRAITVEDWDDFVIIGGHFGTLVNRTLARLIGHVLSEDVGLTVGIQHDAYRIVLQTLASADSAKVIGILRKLSDMDVSVMLSEASKKTGLFKRRMVHVARRFGAISRWTDFRNVSLRQLMKSFEGTVIMEESLKETFDKDLDVPNTKKILEEIREERIPLINVKTKRQATPIARVGMERISRKTDLIPPEKMKHILLESAKARILNEVKTLVCTNCWKFIKMTKMRDLPKRIVCPKCKSKSIGVSDELEEELREIRKKKGKSLSNRQKGTIERVEKSAELTRKYGKAAALVLAGKKLSADDAEEVLSSEGKISDRLFELIMEAERNALRRRFW